MTTEEDEENQSLLEIYFRSQAAEFAKFFNGLTAYTLQIISTKKITKRNISTNCLDFRNPKLSLILSIAILLTLATSLPMMGLLQNEKPNPPILDVEVHSGLWGSIPTHETSSQTFKVENPTEHTLTLELKTLNWTPIMASKDIEVSWDYDGTPLLPGEAAYIRINLENIGLSGTIIVSLDIHITAMLN